MSAGETIIRSLQMKREMEKQGTFGFVQKSSPRSYLEEVSVGGVRLRARIEDFDRFGLLLRGVDVKVEKPIERTVGKDFCELIERFLAEPVLQGEKFEIVEKDEGSLFAVLRTRPEGKVPPGFFELSLEGCREAHLRSYTVGRGSKKRRPSASNLTMEAFCRLVDKMIDILLP